MTTERILPSGTDTPPADEVSKKQCVYH